MRHVIAISSSADYPVVWGERMADDTNDERKASAKRPVSAKQLDSFRLYRERFREQYSDASKIKEIEPLFSPATIQRLKESEEAYPSTNFAPYMQRRLIWLYQQRETFPLYKALSATIGQQDHDLKHIVSNYLGEYRYFRFKSHEGHDNVEYCTGRLLIEKDGAGHPIFQHWSHDIPLDRNPPEHEGMVFRHGDRLYFAGRRPGVMRLAVAQEFDANGILNALLLSVRDKGPCEPFCARAIVVPLNHTGWIDKFSDAISGEKAFRDYTERQGHYYMLIR